MLSATNYAQNYAGIIGKALVGRPGSPTKTRAKRDGWQLWISHIGTARYTLPLHRFSLADLLYPGNHSLLKPQNRKINFRQELIFP